MPTLSTVDIASRDTSSLPTVRTMMAKASCKGLRHYYIMGSYVNSETGHSEDQQPNLTGRHALGSVKRVKVRATGDLRAHPLEVVGHRPALPACRRLVTYRYPSVASGMLTQAQWAWERGRAPRGGQCAKECATARGEKINLIIAVARAGEGQQIPRPSPMVPSWHKNRKGQVRSWGGASRSNPRSVADPQGISRTE